MNACLLVDVERRWGRKDPLHENSVYGQCDPVSRPSTAVAIAAEPPKLGQTGA